MSSKPCRGPQPTFTQVLLSPEAVKYGIQIPAQPRSPRRLLLPPLEEVTHQTLPPQHRLAHFVPGLASIPESDESDSEEDGLRRRNGFYALYKFFVIIKATAKRILK